MSCRGGRGQESHFIKKRKAIENSCYLLVLTALLAKYQTVRPNMRQRASGERVLCFRERGALAVGLCAHSSDEFRFG